MPNDAPNPPSKEKTAHLIREIWGALLEPSWTKDELISLGKLVYAKVPLREVEPKLFQGLLPRLSQVAQRLGVVLESPEQENQAPKKEG